MRRICAVATLLASSLSAGTLTVRPHAVASAECSETHVVVEAVCNNPICPIPRFTDFNGDPVVFDVDWKFTWRVSVRGRCWGEALTTQGRHAVSVDMWPASAIAGTFEVPPGNPAPGSLYARLQGVAGTGIDDTEVKCTIHGHQWGCSVPATPLNVRLTPAGYAAFELRNLQPPAYAPLQAGTIRLEPAPQKP